MIHPHTELKLVSDAVGYGVFARRPIPAGTIVYVRDPLEIVVTPAAYRVADAASRVQIDRYSYIDERGDRVISWDFAKYVNHSCEANTISTGYGFEVAIRDIAAGEEITDEYGCFNLDQELDCCCGSPACRHAIREVDFDNLYEAWDKRVLPVAGRMAVVEQPLWYLLSPAYQTELERLRENPDRLRSVYELRWREVRNGRPALADKVGL